LGNKNAIGGAFAMWRTRDWVAVKTLRTKGLTKLVSVVLLLLLPGFSQGESKLFTLFDDQGTPRHVQVWGWGRGKGLICQKIAKSGKESVEVTSPELLSGAVIAGDFNLVVESLPWSRSLLRFWLRLAEGEKGTQFNVHISTDGGDADCYFNIEKNEKEDGWVLVRFWLDYHFFNFAISGELLERLGQLVLNLLEEQVKLVRDFSSMPSQLKSRRSQ
jgi:hypothetical protein